MSSMHLYANTYASCPNRRRIPRVACMTFVKENGTSLGASHSSGAGTIMVHNQFVRGIYDSGLSLGATYHMSWSRQNN